MADWTQRLLSELDDSDRRAEKVARGLTAEQLNWRPRPDAWSVGQCLDHLYAANQVYLPAISASLQERRESRVEEIALPWFGRWFIRSFIEPSSQTRRARAPRKIQPAKQAEPSALDSFLRSNQATRELVQTAGAYDVNRIRFRNPFVPLLRFTVGTGLEIISKHQSRHLLQAERVRQTVNFPKS